MTERAQQEPRAAWGVVGTSKNTARAAKPIKKQRSGGNQSTAKDPRSHLKRDKQEDGVHNPQTRAKQKEIKINDPLDYISRIKVGRDGLIVENKFATGLLLPQVPIEYGWNEKEFLEFTCQKAGLDKNAWKDKKTKISNFQGIVFAEKSPKGDIDRKRIR